MICFLNCRGGDPLGGVGGTVTDTVQQLVSTVGGDDILGGVLSANHPLLDANVSTLTSALPTADDHALINADLTVLAHTDSTPQAMGMGLLDVDGSLLSTSSAGVSDGVSATLNLNTVTHDILPGVTTPVIDVTIPLPTLAQSVPMSTPITDTIADVGHSVQAITNNLTDSTITLAALTQAPSPIAAVDAGVLFAGSNNTVGHHDIVPVIPAHDLPQTHLLGGLFGAHH